MTATFLSTVVEAYLECALWSEGFDESSIGDFSPASAAKAKEVCGAFLMANADDLLLSGLDTGQIGHDLWLTRNHHGAGFWDRGLGEVGKRLTAATHVLPEVSVIEGDDGQLEIE